MWVTCTCNIVFKASLDFGTAEVGMGTRASGQGRVGVPGMSVLETAGNSYICEAKGLTPQAPAPDFSSLMGCVLQLEPKLTLLYRVGFLSTLSQKQTKQQQRQKPTKPSRPTCSGHDSYRTAQVTVVVSNSA